MKQIKYIVVCLLAIVMILPLMSCGKTDVPQASDTNTEINKVVSDCVTYNPEDAQNAAMDFSLRLFQNSVNTSEEENVLIAPTSVLTALAMTANGAQNDTLTQMEAVFGMEREPLRDYMKLYLENLPSEEKYKLHMANSIWIKNDENFTVNEDFIETNKNYFDADVYEKDFGQKTLKEINHWVKDETKGMIEEVLSEIPEDAVMYLINALAFEAEWEEIYDATQIREGVFTLENGIEQNVEFMYSEENVYLEDEKATGFVKYYADKAYAYVALLPKENIGVSEYVESMSSDELKELLENPVEIKVKAAIPKFEVEDDILLNENLKYMGMVDAFDGQKADFQGIGTHTNGNLFINRVIHKTHLEVDEKGTKAGAATVVEVNLESAMEMPEAKEVYLKRPFIYMIIDCERNQPIFMGTTNYIHPYKCGLEPIS